MHEQHVFHADIKDENIMFRTTDGVDVPLIADFGTSVDVSEDPEEQLKKKF